VETRDHLAQRVHEDRQTEKAVDDRRHTRQVPDVRVDEARHARVARVLLDIHGGPDADGQRDNGHDRHQDQRPRQRLGDPCPRRDGRVAVGEETHAPVHERGNAFDRGAPQHQDEHAQRDHERQHQDGLEQPSEQVTPVPRDRSLDLGDRGGARHPAGHQ